MAKRLDNETAVSALTDESVALASALEDVDTSDGRALARAVYSNEETTNAFYKALNNVLVRQKLTNDKAWVSPFRQLEVDTITYGNTIQEIAVNMYKQYDYGVEADEYNPATVFKQTPADIVTRFHSINYQKYTPATIAQEEGSRAFLTEGGIGALASAQLTQMRNGDESFMYGKVKATIVDALDKSMIKTVVVGDTANKEALEELSVAIREHSKLMSFIDQGKTYTNAMVDTFARPEDLVLVTTPRVAAEMSVKFLANVFQLDEASFDKSDILSRVIVLDNFGTNTDVVAILMDKKCLGIVKKLYMTTSQYDALHLTNNFFLHNQGMVYFSEMFPCVAFVKTGSSPVPTQNYRLLSAQGQNLTPGETSQIAGYYNDTLLNPDAQTFTCSGGNGNSSIDANTGILTVDADEAVGNQLIVSGEYNGENATILIDIV